MSGRVIRSLNENEVAILVDWAAGEGWNPGLADARAFRAADPDGFIGAFVDGEMVAGIAAVCYSSDFGFIGLYICRPGQRGEGHGRAVWHAGVERLGNRTIGLDGVDAQIASYRRKGFAAAYRTVRYGGMISGCATGGFEPIDVGMLPEIGAFDARFFPARRDAFLERWLAPPHVALAAVEGGGALTGYGVARPCRDGVKIGPIVALTEIIALRLCESLAAAFPGATLYIDVPEPRSDFSRELEARGLTPGFVTTRMYRGLAPAAALPYAVTSLELG